MKLIRWGIIGCGSVAEYKGGPALYKVLNSTLLAVMSRNEERAKSFAERHHAKRCYTSIEDLLSDSEIDAVYIAAPPNTHAELTEKAARSKKHVLCEKPMALNVAECRKMIAACRKNNVQLMVAYYRRFYPVVKKIKYLLNEGVIGKPVYCRFLTSSLYDGEPNWRLDPKVSGGGYLFDVGSHRLDLLAYFFGKPKKVSAFVGANHLDIPVDDSSSLILEFAGGLQAVCQFFWAMATPVDELDIGGTKGRILSRNLEKGELQVIIGKGIKEYIFPRHQITHYSLVENYVKSLLSGKPNSLPGEEGMITSQIIEKAVQSSREDRAKKI
ncbi:MAG: Gfo/Idh/MocA family oxidoreductase [Candidatus Omnitrophota bacterium]